MQLTRRFFLRCSGAAAALLGCGGLAPLARAMSRPLRLPPGKTLVVVFLRGGADGLNLVVPFGDERYYALRDYIAIRPPGRDDGAVDLDGFFGLHPAAASLAPFFREGSAVAVQGVGSARNSRSHFEEQDVWETALFDNALASQGWLNRHLATTEGEGILRAVALADTLPRILRGDRQVLALRGLSDLGFGARESELARALAMLEKVYGDADASGEAARDLIAREGRSTLAALRELQKIARARDDSEVEYPNDALAQRFRDAARLIRADVGVEVIELDLGGWDTHQNQGGANGPFANLVRTLSNALAAFARDLGDRMDDVQVLTLSEFGRTAAMNGTGGTDHGWGSCLLALGGGVARAKPGKPVLGEWPGLEPDELWRERDLRQTTDFRDVLAEVVGNHLGHPKVELVIPERDGRAVGLA